MNEEISCALVNSLWRPAHTEILLFITYEKYHVDHNIFQIKQVETSCNVPCILGPKSRQNVLLK
jgi:hypothetical protein